MIAAVSGPDRTAATPPAPVGRGRPATPRPVRDAILSRGLRYGLLTLYAATVAVGILVLGGGGQRALISSRWAGLAVLLAVVATIVPVHGWLRARIDRLIYDWHADPYAVLSELRQQLGSERERAPRAIVPTIAATVAATLRLPYVAIEADLGEGMTLTAHGTRPPLAEVLAIPLAFQGERIGALQAAARRPGEALSLTDQQLLRDLAGQVGITLHAARLSAAVQVSREQLANAREEERRRIRRDLHDGLGPTLASLRLQLGAVRRALRDEPDEAEALIDGLRDDLRAATAEIRRLVYGLRPPLLDEHGLDGALRGLGAVIAPATLVLDLPEPLPPLNAALEVALYRIVSEVAQNVARHAGAASCAVRLVVGDGSLMLTIRDDGVGLSAERATGVGLFSTRERAAELGGALAVASAPGGGTCVTASFPWRGAT